MGKPKCTTKRHKRALRTPEAKRARIVARSIAGENKTDIAKAERVNRHTVAHILNQSEIQAIIRETSSRIYALMPKAVAAPERLLDKDNAQTVVAVLTGMQVFVPKSKVTQSTPAQAELEKRGLAGRSDEDIEYFLEHGYFPEEEVQ